MKRKANGCFKKDMWSLRHCTRAFILDHKSYFMVIHHLLTIMRRLQNIYYHKISYKSEISIFDRRLDWNGFKSIESPEHSLSMFGFAANEQRHLNKWMYRLHIHCISRNYNCVDFSSGQTLPSVNITKSILSTSASKISHTNVRSQGNITKIRQVECFWSCFELISPNSIVIADK